MAPKKLTVKQEAFVLAYLETNNGREAYRRAYNADGMSDASIDKEVYKLVNHPVVAPRVQQTALHVQAKAVLTLDDHMSKLEELREVAVANGQTAAAIKAEELRGKLMRHYVIQVEHGGVGEFARMEETELDEFIKQESKSLGLSATRH